MSATIFEEVEGLIVGTYCGPDRNDGMSRTRWHLTLHGIAEARGYVTLSFEEVHALSRALDASLTQRQKRALR